MGANADSGLPGRRAEAKVGAGVFRDGAALGEGSGTAGAVAMPTVLSFGRPFPAISQTFSSLSGSSPFSVFISIETLGAACEIAAAKCATIGDGSAPESDAK